MAICGAMYTFFVLGPEATKWESTHMTVNVSRGTYHQQLYGPQHVQGSCKCVAKVEHKTSRAPKLGS